MSASDAWMLQGKRRGGEERVLPDDMCREVKGGIGNMLLSHGSKLLPVSQLRLTMPAADCLQRPLVPRVVVTNLPSRCPHNACLSDGTYDVCSKRRLECGTNPNVLLLAHRGQMRHNRECVPPFTHDVCVRVVRFALPLCHPRFVKPAPPCKPACSPSYRTSVLCLADM